VNCVFLAIPMIIFHITTEAAWQAAQQKGEYIAESLATEGFIHASRASQVQPTLQRYFAGQTNLVLLHIDTQRLNNPLRYDVATEGQYFPHIYGSLNLSAVIKVTAL
jgi:uncharacterized protein (DUF952 family)